MMNLEKILNVRTMDEAVKSFAVPEKKNEEYVEADVIPEFF